MTYDAVVVVLLKRTPACLFVHLTIWFTLALFFMFLSPQPSAKTLQQESGTDIPSWLKSSQSDVVLAPQHFSCREREGKRERVRVKEREHSHWTTARSGPIK